MEPITFKVELDKDNFYRVLLNGRVYGYWANLDGVIANIAIELESRFRPDGKDKGKR